MSPVEAEQVLGGAAANVKVVSFWLTNGESSAILARNQMGPSHLFSGCP